MAAAASRTAATASIVTRHRLAARTWLAAMVVVAVSVQGLVWGAPRLHGNGGSALPQLRHLFGIGYALILLGAVLAYCALFRLPGAAVWVLVTGACVDVAFWAAHLAGLRFPTGAAAALTAGAATVILAAGVLLGRFQPAQTRRWRPFK